MAYQNPAYNADWETVHDRHDLQRTQAKREMIRLAGAGQMMTDACDAAKAAFDLHHQACLDAHQSQFATVQDYARWLSENWSLPYGYDASIPMPHMDIEGLRTMQEASAAFSRASRELEDAVNKKQNRLPIGQPEGLIAFAKANSVGLHRYWREFSPRDLYPQGYTPSGLRTLVTVDEIDDDWHVCFMQDWDSPSVTVTVTNAIDKLATAFFREANAIAEQQVQHSGKKGLRAWFARWTTHKHAPLLDPDRFHFYEHLPPTAHSKEDFARVTMRFKNGEYQHPEWIHFRGVPAIIQSAREYLKKSENTQGGSLLNAPMIQAAIR
jgi:hypothetical protein